MSEEFNLNDFEVIVQKFLGMIVCAPKRYTPEDVERAANLLNPAGTTLGWRIADQAEFHDDTTNPCDCDEHAERQHWVLWC